MVAILNRLRFSRTEQQMFLSRLGTMLQAALPLRSIFDVLLKFPCNESERKIAAQSLESIGNGEPFAAGYATSGWFPPQVSALLVAGEEHSCLSRSLSTALDSYKGAFKPRQWLLYANMRWYLTLAIVCGICVFLQQQHALFQQVLGTEQTFGQQLVFLLGAGLLGWGPTAAAGLGLGAALVVWQLHFGTSSLRLALDKGPLFGRYRQMFAGRVLAEMAGFIAAGMGPLAAVDVLLSIYDKGYRHQRLIDLRHGLAAGMEPSEALSRTLLDGKYQALLTSLMLAYPGRSAMALQELGNMLVADLETHFRRLGQQITFICLMILLVLAYGILDLIYAAPLPLS